MTDQAELDAEGGPLSSARQHEGGWEEGASRTEPGYTQAGWCCRHRDGHCHRDHRSHVRRRAASYYGAVGPADPLTNAVSHRSIDAPGSAEPASLTGRTYNTWQPGIVNLSDVKRYTRL